MAVSARKTKQDVRAKDCPFSVAELKKAFHAVEKHCRLSGFQVCTELQWDKGISKSWVDSTEFKKELGGNLKSLDVTDNEMRVQYNNRLRQEEYFPIGTMCVIDRTGLDTNQWSIGLYEKTLTFDGVIGVTVDRLDIFDVMKRYHALPSRLHVVTHEPYPPAPQHDCDEDKGDGDICWPPSNHSYGFGDD